jgi:hypothetical protein
VTWALEGGVRAAGQHLGGGGWAGLALIGLVAGVVSGVAEALGKFFFRFTKTVADVMVFPCRFGVVR